MPVDEEFIDRILEGEASGSEVAEFQRWLTIPANMERFALRANLHSDLRRSLRRSHIQHNALDAHTDDSANAAPPQRGNTRSQIFRSQGTLLLAAGLLAAACLLIAFSQPFENERQTPAETSAATVISAVNEVLRRDGRPWNEANLPVGTYELTQGLLNLEFGGGVMVYLEAPAHFYSASDKRLVLHGGRLSARVPPEGIGFTVETPDAEVIDFGTEFSIDVEEGASEVHVFDGLVRVHPGTSDQRDRSKSVDLQASQAVRITDGAAEPEDISVASDRFIRNFDEPKLNYVRAIKRLSPLSLYRMPIRDRGLVSDPPEYSGVVLTGEGRRPPHARGVFVGGSLRVGADSVGRGGRVDSPPAFRTGQFSLSVFVYLENPVQIAKVATSFDEGRGSFDVSLHESGTLRVAIRHRNGGVSSVTGDAVLPLKTWRHVVMTVDGERLQLYEDGNPVASTLCTSMKESSSDAIWFGTDAKASQVWNGRIDEVALFDRALTAEEITTLFNTAQKEIGGSR